MVTYSSITITNMREGSQIWTTSVAPTTPNYTFTISNLSGDTDVAPRIGDIIVYSYYRYTITSVGSSTVQTGNRISIKGADGSSAVWYSGNGITGTSVTPTIFPNSTIASAIVGDMYLNSDTLNTYRCTVAGSASVAKWVYVSNIKGSKGDDGKGITYIKNQYYLATNNTGEPTGGTWEDTIPTFESDKYYWTRSQITWSDTTVTYTVPVVDDALTIACGDSQLALQIVENMEIGGRNLWLNTLIPNVNSTENFPRMVEQVDYTHLYSTSNSGIEVAEHGVKVTVKKATKRPRLDFGSFNDLNGFENGQTYTVSFDWSAKLYTSEDSETTRYLGFYIYDNHTGSTVINESCTKRFFVITQDLKGVEQSGRLEFTFTIDSSATTARISIMGNADAGHAVGDYFELSNMKIEKGNVPTSWTPAPEDIVTEVTELKENLQSQIDAKIETYYQSDNPATDWTTSELRMAHDGDLWCYTGTTTSTYTQDNVYRYDGTNNTWTVYSANGDLFDKIDGKITIYYGTTTDTFTGVEEGDYLVDSTDGSTYRYHSNSWVKVTDYQTAVDVVGNQLSTFINTTYASDKTDLQSQIDGKAETWYQSNDPSTGWTTSALKAQHEGDIWYRTTDGTTWFYNGTSWVQQNVPDEVFDKIDGKAQVFTSNPLPPYNEGDLWFNSETSDIMTCINSRLSGNFVSSDWEKRNKYTDDTAVENLEIGGRNLILNTLYPDATGSSLKRPHFIGQVTNTTGRGTCTVAEHGIRFTCTSENWAYIYFGSSANSSTPCMLGLEAGETYTFSADLSWKILSSEEGMADEATRYIGAMLWYSKVDSGSFSALGTINGFPITQADKGTEMSGRLEYTFTVPTTAKRLYFGIRSGDVNASHYAIGDYIEARNLMLEKGEKVTLWTPAPEDYVKSIDSKADASLAIEEEQTIYISKPSGTLSVTPPTEWITAETYLDDGVEKDYQNTWTRKRPEYTSDYPVLFIATQKKKADGSTPTCTTPLKDNTTTVIDGGHITTGTIDASVVNVNNINASNITIGTLDASRIAANSLIVGQNVVGWTVLVKASAIDYSSNTATLVATVYKNGVKQTSGFTAQWYKDETIISGATSTTLNVTAQMGLDASYTCFIN